MNSIGAQIKEITIIDVEHVQLILKAIANLYQMLDHIVTKQKILSKFL